MAKGGAICTMSGNISVLDSNFADNAALFGGAIHSDSGISDLKDSNFTNNDANYSGGAVHTGADIHIANSSFIGGDVLIYGGAIFAYNLSNVFAEDSIFENNTSNECGGAIVSVNGLYLSNATFSNNFANDSGGAICSWGDVLLNNSKFINNSAEYAGALYSFANGGVNQVISSDFTGNSANAYGALYLTGTSSLTDSTFIGNRARGGNAGAVMNYGDLSIGNCSFRNNSALFVADPESSYVGYDYGGAICNYGWHFYLNDTEFIDNSADKGGAFANFAQEAFVENSDFINNSANHGGAAYTDYRANLTIRNSTFANNSANAGGAIIHDNSQLFEFYIANENGDNLFVESSRFMDNTAISGGAIFDCNCSSIIANSNFTDNCGEDGETIYDYLGHINIVNSTLENRNPVDYAIIGTVDHFGSKIIENGNDVTEEYVNYTRVPKKDNGGDNGNISDNITDKDNFTGNSTDKDNFTGNSTDKDNNTGNSTDKDNFTGNVTGNITDKENSTDNVSVKAKSTSLSILVNNVILGQSAIVNFTLSSSDNANINASLDVLINKKPYNVNIKNGKGSLTVSKLPVGNYTVSASYNGNSNYKKSSASVKFTVKDRIETRIIYNDMYTGPVPKGAGRIGNYFCVRLVDENNNPLAGVPIKIGFNGKAYNKTTDLDGGAKLQINLQYENIYTFAICFLGDDEYKASFEVAKIDVSKKYPKPNKANESSQSMEISKVQKNTRLLTSIVYSDMLTESVLKSEGRAGKYFTVKLLDNNRKPLADMDMKIGFNGKVYNKTTDSTGEARLQINLLKPTTYTFAIAYLGDEKYQASFEVAKITVSKNTPKLSASPKTFKRNAKTKTVSATLKSSRGAFLQGKKISFTVNGKTYTGTTNGKGLASVKISLSKKGKYTVTAKFAGDANTKATSVKFILKIV